MYELMIFEGYEVEVLELGGKVYFNPYHVGSCLEMAPGTVKDHMSKMNEKQVIKIRNSDVGLTNFRKLNNAGENFLTESGVYKLTFKSRKPDAEKFTDWIADEVLPTIRKYGMYAKDELLDNPDLLLDVVTQYKAEREQRLALEKENARMKPKEIFADAVSVSHTTILIGELAKILKQNGIEIGQNRLFEWMRQNGYLISRKGTDYNMPTQKSMDLQLFQIKERTINNPDGSVRITKTVLVTGKGQQYFINKFLDKETATS